MKQLFSASITEENGTYVAQCLEIDVASQGSTSKEAMENLKEALVLYFEQPMPSDKPSIQKLSVEINAS